MKSNTEYQRFLRVLKDTNNYDFVLRGFKNVDELKAYFNNFSRKDYELFFKGDRHRFIMGGFLWTNRNIPKTGRRWSQIHDDWCDYLHDIDV
mgnify:CR=1 FL=1